MIVAMVTSGPGNDLDVANIFRSGRSIVLHGTYTPSRAPGSPVHELIVGVLDRIGGPLLTNLASVAAAVALLVGLDRLLEGEGLSPAGRLATLVVAANPWFLVAATSTVDYLLALALLVGGALALRQDRTVVAGVLFALSIGCRLTTAVLVAAVLVAEVTRPHPDPGEKEPETDGDRARDPNRWRMVLVAGAVTAVGTVLAFLPAFLSTGDLSFARNDFRTSTLGQHIGRAGAKDLALLGTFGSLAALLFVPAVVRTLTAWRVSWLVRFAVLGLVGSQLVFLRFPWKMSHLLPSLVCGVVLVAVATDRRPSLRPLLVVLILTQLAYGVVRVELIEPDDPDHATGATVAPTVDWGPVVTDWQCRREHRDAYRGRQKVEVEAAWTCARQYGG